MGSAPASHGFDLEAHTSDGRLVLRLAGELDSEAAPELRRRFDQLEVDGDAVLDLTDLTFIDSSGLGCLFRLQQRVADTGGLLEAHGAQPPVRQAMQMVQLNRVIALLD
jgi:N-acetylglucosaminyldiphosphoundecaprenol N-acetyl-beta-D-mannosaminyltransferase